MTALMTTAQALTESLVRNGIDTVYGLPGVHNDPLFDAFFGMGPRLRVIHTRHEQACGYMALGAALATGLPQAFAVVPGPGFLNASAAMLTAFGMNAPVMALLGQIPRADLDRGIGHLHEVRDQIGMAAHITKYAARIEAPHEAPDQVAAALGAAVSGRQGPVALECAMDVWGRSGPVALHDTTVERARTPIDARAVEHAAAVIAGAKAPLIMVGGGAAEACAAVTALAERLEAPVFSFRRGRGVVPTTHRLAVNLAMGHALWTTADVVIGIGTRMQWPLTGWGLDAGMKVVRLDIDPVEMGRVGRPDAQVLGDARETVAALLAALPRRVAPSREAELAKLRAWNIGKLARLAPQMDYLAAIRAALPPDGVFVDEVTQVGFVSRLAFPVDAPRRFLSPGYQDNLGWGYGAALGAQAALPGAPVLAIAGDGGVMYQIAELATAVRHKLNVVLVVFDNGMFGNVRRIQEEAYGGRIIATDLANPDFVRLAESFGVRGYRARTGPELERAIRAAFEAAAPALVHVPCGPMPSPWDMILMPRVRGAALLA